ncbi:MAG: penicillin-binding protein 1C [Acidobacteriota bacterium]
MGGAAKRFGHLARSRRARAAAAFLLASIPLVLWLRCGPLPEGFLDPSAHQSTQVVDRRGAPLYESLSEREGRSAWLAPDSLPATLVNATLAAEDGRFFLHPGLDPLALGRALWHDAKAGRIKEGGSTLTQQAVKRLMGRPRTVGGKLREMVYALRLEHRLSKREILALYLNLAPYGNQFVGASAASRGYFGCSPQDLTPAQAAFLAGLPQRPTALDPYKNLDSALGRQRWVLGRMRALGFLNGEDHGRALRERLKVGRPDRPFLAPHFVERVLGGLEGRRASRVETALDLDLQGDVRGILAAGREARLAHGAHNAAVVVLLNETGEVLAYEGSGDYFDGAHGGAIDGAASPRQPGSALKPFTYALAFEKGFTPASVLPDVPSHFPTAQEGVLYAPRNYDGVFRGPMRARVALAGSENVPAVYLLSKVGVADLLGLLRAAGFSTLDRNADFYGFGLTLGDAEVRLDEVAAAYAALARGGLYLPPRLVRRVRWSDGSSTSPAPAEPRRILSPRAAFWAADVLSDPSARAWAFGSGGSLDFPFPVAVKTGTSQAYRDNWCVGFTREVTVGVWVGNFDRTPLVNSSGVTGAGPLFHDVLVAAQRRATGRLPGPADPPLADLPEGLSPLEICALSGLTASPLCPRVEREWLPPSAAPVSCSWHGKGGTVAWPSEYRSWARSAGRLEEGATALPAPPPPGGERRASAPPLVLLNPPAGAVYLLDPTLRPGFQTLPFRAAAEGPPRTLLWLVDGAEVGRASSDGSLDWPLTRGTHVVEVRDGRGHSARAEIVVK